MNTIEIANVRYEAKKYLNEIECASVIQDPCIVIKNLLFFLTEYERELDGERRVSAALKAASKASRAALLPDNAI